MAVKMDPAYVINEDGSLTLLEVSIVTCADDDPHRLRDSEGHTVTVTELRETVPGFSLQDEELIQSSRPSPSPRRPEPE